MERLLLLWDELDELAGATRHLAVGFHAGLLGAGREAIAHLGRRLKVRRPA